MPGRDRYQLMAKRGDKTSAWQGRCLDRGEYYPLTLLCACKCRPPHGIPLSVAFIRIGHFDIFAIEAHRHNVDVSLSKGHIFF